MAKKTEQLNMRVTPEAKHLLQELAQTLGISQANVFEMAIRQFAQLHPISTKPKG